MEVASYYIEKGVPKSTILLKLNISKSSYYYKSKLGERKAGRPMSSHTYKDKVGCVSNDQVVKDIEALLTKEFVDYGYLKTTYYLKDELGYNINHKKVYNLMNINKLLNKPNRNINRSKRNWIKDFVPNPVSDFAHLEFDIKYFYVLGKKRNAMVLTIIDVKSRWVLGQIIKWRLNYKDVKELFEEVFLEYNFPKQIYVRCDNGSQFVANEIQQYFKEYDKIEVIQEFTRPATPEQNAHIESYHSIVEKVICQRYELKNIKDLEEILTRFKAFYNFERIHSGVGYISPYKYLLKQGIDMNTYPSSKSFCRTNKTLNLN